MLLSDAELFMEAKKYIIFQPAKSTERAYHLRFRLPDGSMEVFYDTSDYCRR